MTPQTRAFPQRPSKAERIGPQRPPPGARLSLAPGLGAGTVTFKEPEPPKIEERPLSPIKKKPEVTEEERKAIIERRKSAAQFSEPDFAHVPGLGSRRSSALPPVMPPSPFKAIRENIDEGEDTKSVMKKMEESLDNMRRKSLANIGMGRPSMGAGRGRGTLESPPKPKSEFSLLSSPTKVPAFQLFVGSTNKSLRFDEALIEEPEGEEADGDNVPDAFADAEECGVENDENKEPISRYPETPRLGDIRHMFSKVQAEAGITTPAVRGVRELFKVEKDNPRAPRTPRMSSVRKLFIEKKTPPTPRFDGIEEMMHIEEEQDAEEEEDMCTEEVVHEAHVIEEKEVINEPEAQVQGPTAKSIKSPVTRIPKTATRTKSTRATPLTGSSAFADDEATPDTTTGITQGRSKRAVEAGVPEAAVIHRGGRTARRAVGAVVNTDEPVKAKTRLTTNKKAAEDIVSE